jgi:hypothetical protein
MRRLLVWLAVAALLAGPGLGCPGDKDKAIYSNRDRPTAEPRRSAERDKTATEPRGTEPEKGTTERRDSGR